MLIKYTGKYVNIYFIMKITFLGKGSSMALALQEVSKILMKSALEIAFDQSSGFSSQLDNQD